MSNSLNIQIILLNQKKYLSISKGDSSRAKFFMSEKEFKIILRTGMKVNACFPWFGLSLKFIVNVIGKLC